MANAKDIATSQRQYAQGAINQATLQDIASMIESLIDLQIAGMPDISRHYDFSVTDQQRTIDKSVIVTMPWISFSLCNDGPNPVYVDVNESVNMMEQPYLNAKENKYAPVNVNEEFRFNMKRSGIKRIILQCDSGGTANVRLYADAKRHGTTNADFLKIVEGELAGDFQ